MSPAPDYNHKWKILLIISLGIFMSTLDGSILNIANPVIAEEFATTMASIQWIVTVYMLVITTTLIFWGRLGDKIGGDKLYNAGFLLFTLGSGFCALSPTLAVLIAARAFQGIGSSMLMATGMGIVSNSFPVNEKGKAFGITGAVVGIGNMSGPVIGGGVLVYFNWPVIFLINIPIGVFAFWMGRRYLPDQPKNREVTSFDVPGMIIFSAFTSALLLSLHFSAYISIWHIVFILMLLLIFLVWEKLSKESLLDFSLFSSRRFSIGNTMVLLVHTAQMGVLFLLPFYIKNVLGFSSAYSGLILTTSPIALAVMAPIAGVLSDRLGSKKILFAAFTLIMSAFIIFANISLEHSLFMIIVALVLLGLGTGSFSSPNNSDILKSVPPEKAGYAGGFNATIRNLAFVIGITFSSKLFPVVFDSYMQTMSYKMAYAAACSKVYMILTFLSVIGFILTFFIPAEPQEF